MKKLINVGKKRLLTLILLPFVILGGLYIYDQQKSHAVGAVDILQVTYDGHFPPDPMFYITNMLPGDEVEKVFNVKNGSSSAFNVYMKGIFKEEEKEFADILEIIIGVDGGVDIYGGTTGFKTVQNFLDEVNPLDLGSLGAGNDKNFRVKVRFPSSAGNEYQLAKVVFDLQWSAQITGDEIPPECKDLPITRTIVGTDGNDKIYGTTASELILGKGGNDKIYASSGSDCIVGGDGNDDIKGESGNEVILGGAGNDKIDSGSGNDIVYGGDGNDNIDTGSGNDLVYGGEGNDNINGGSDNDELHGGTQNDTLRGGSGDDKLYGDEGNDNIHAGSGNDYLNGGPNEDNLHGDSGSDTCINGEIVQSCEL